jgi:hypothetical protein
MSFSTNSVGFIFGLLLIALICWYVRARLEANPEPFFLSFTLFAFAGQFIRSGEWAAKLIFSGVMLPGLGKLFILLGVAGVTVAFQVFVMKAHFDMTRAHYRALLHDHLKSSKDNQIDNWATVLLRVTGVDFFPGSYKWLFPVEPKEESRRLAISVLPSRDFNKSRITADSLIVPATPQRKLYWWLYVGLCLLAWLWFVLAMGIAL